MSSCRSKAADLRKAGSEVITLSEDQSVGEALKVSVGGSSNKWGPG